MLQLLGRLPMLVALGVLLLGLLMVSRLGSDSARGAEPSGLPDPLASRTPPPIGTPWPTMTPQEMEQALERNRQMLASGVSSSGPHTAGSRITIGGKAIQLPPDAYVEGYVDSIFPLEGRSNPLTPIVGIRRGNSLISVSIPNGAIVYENIAPGEERTFDFLKAALTQ